MPLTPGSRIGSYEVTVQIGVGGMGEVYRATDSNLKRAVALKVLPESVAADADRLARFQREAQVLAALNHPHIGAIYGLERSGGTTALVMELVEGPTLADRLASGALPIDEVRAIARQIAEALEAAHEQGIVHRDLKPANIKVRPDGTVKVLDFGLAKAVGGSGLDSNSGSGSIAPTLTSPAMTMAGMILGTAAYMAPEQAKGRPVDRRADVWAFGAVLYEMLTGTRAFDGDDVSDVLASVLAREPDWTRLSTSPAGLATCVRRCLQRDPKQRFGDMQSVRLALDGAFDAAAAPIAEARAAPARFASLPWSIAAAATLALVALAVAYVRQPAADRPVIRTAITAPKNTSFDFDGTVGPAVISPDGRLLAFSARTSTGQIQLWVRPLDAPDARPLEGTEGASFPFWSPDSRSVGYYSAARGRLERVEVSGGAPVVIASGGFVRGASWGADGVVVYDSSDTGSRIMSASIAGGTPTPVVTKGLPRSPAFLPDGRHFLYFSRSPRRQVRVASIDGATDEAVIDAASGAVYASGYLLFLREGTLLAQPFDPVRRALSGSPVAVARGVRMLLGDPRGIFSASENGLLLYQDGAEAAATNLVWFGRDGTRQSIVAEMGTARGVFLSPDNRAAVVGVADVEGQLNLERVDTAGGERRRLTFEPSTGEVSPFTTWSPDGRSVAYALRRGDTLLLARTPVAGGPEERLSQLDAAPFGGFIPRLSAWTADNTLILTGEAIGGVFTLPLSAGSTPKPFGSMPENTHNVRLSPNGRWVAYQASVDRGAVLGIFVDAFPGGGRQQPVTDRGTLPVWSADGRALYYANDNVLSVVDVAEADGGLRFGAPRAVMPVIIGRGYSYDVARDGRILALVTTEQRASRPLTLVQNWVASLGSAAAGR